jgi:uncharacterized protein with HEPN domain
MKNELGNKARLHHILDAILYIQMALKNETEESFFNNFILNAAVVKWFENIGESSTKLTKEFKQEKKEVEWKKIEGLRHVLVHEYFGIDLQRVWILYQDFVPQLKNNIEEFLKEIN